MIKLVSGSPPEIRMEIERAAQEIVEAQELRLSLALSRRLLFLEFDGVLNHSAWFHLQDSDERVALAERDLQDFDPACMQRLNLILEKTAAVVVVSSSWRYGRSVEELYKILVGYGFKGTVIDKTPSNHSRPHGHPFKQRGDEIRAWLDALPKPNHRFVVLDDNSDMDAVWDNFVFTSFHDGGLTDKKVDEVLALYQKLDG